MFLSIVDYHRKHVCAKVQFMIMKNDVQPVRKLGHLIWVENHERV
jgi:hypothetical protein